MSYVSGRYWWSQTGSNRRPLQCHCPVDIGAARRHSAACGQIRDTTRIRRQAGSAIPEILFWLIAGTLSWLALCVLAGLMIRRFLRKTPGPLTGPFHPPAADLSGECPAGTCRHLDACKCRAGGSSRGLIS